MATDQKFSRIRGLSEIRRLPRLGKIRLGVKAKTAAGKEYPKEVSYFVVPPEISAVYGSAPTELDVMFPTEDEHTIFPQSYKWYVSNGLRCKGNGETAMRRFADMAKGDRSPIANGGEHKPDDLVEVACPCPLLESGQCSQAANLMVLLPKVSLGGVYQIDTGSFHNIVRINSCIDYVRTLIGHISLVPLKLIRQPQEIQYEGKKATHYLLQLELNINLDDAAKLRENARMILSKTERLVLPAPVEDGPEPTGEAAIEAQAPTPAPTRKTTSHQDGPSELCLEWMDALQKTTTIDELGQVWKRLVHKDTGIFKRLSAADQHQLTLIKDEQKDILDYRADEPTFG